MVSLKNSLLVAFQRVVENGTVHGAARELHLTQAGVTKRIRALESELGVTLFLRSRKGMTLTQEGRALLKFCKISNEAEGQLMTALKGQLSSNFQLTIAGPTSTISSRTVKECLPLYFDYPNLVIHFRAVDNQDLSAMIKRGEVDLAIVSPERVVNEMASKFLRSNKYLLLATSEWRGRTTSEIVENERIIDFYESDLTTQNYLKEFQLDKLNRRERIFANENMILLELLKAGVGFGTLAEDVARPYLENGALIKLNRGQILEEKLALVWYPRAEPPEYLRKLLRSIS